MDQQEQTKWSMITAHQMADIIRSGRPKIILVDSRSFLEYNTSHVQDSVNLCCSKLVKRRLQQGKVFIRDMLNQTSHMDVDDQYEIYVYDQCTENPTDLTADCFLLVLLSQLVLVYKVVRLIKGGFLEFQASHPSLCETKSVYPSTSTGTGSATKHTPLTSLSQPCLPVSNVGPTKILPFLYLGSQQDAMSQETLHHFGITYVLNVSTTCPKPSFVPEEHFLRIPVNDTYCEKLLPHFQPAFQFLDKVRESGGYVLVHCLAGISRSPTLAIAYVMRTLNMSTDEAYKYVKDKRQTISPNFNFLGQLLEYEKLLLAQQAHVAKPNRVVPESLTIQPQSAVGGVKLAPRKMLALSFDPRRTIVTSSTNAPSPTTALSRLTFGQQPSPVPEESSLTNTPTTPSCSLAYVVSAAATPIAARPIITFIPASTATSVSFSSGPVTSLTSLHSASPTTPLASSTSTIFAAPLSPASNIASFASVPVTSARLMEMNYPQVPTSYISKINFMPCSAREEIQTMSPSVKRDSGGGIKRSARTSMGLNDHLNVGRNEVTRSASAHNIFVSMPFENNNMNAINDGVQLRSPEAKAKRPLTRPSSISIMSNTAFNSEISFYNVDNALYSSQFQPHPTYKLPSSHIIKDNSCAVKLGDASKGECSSPGHCPQNVMKNACAFQPCEAATAAVPHLASSPRLNSMEQQARISRSLDDILSSPDDGSPERKRPGSGKRHCPTHETTVGLDIAMQGCRGNNEVHQSSSSVSSAGSRSSLHGSHEMIEVS